MRKTFALGLPSLIFEDDLHVGDANGTLPMVAPDSYSALVGFMW